MAQIDRAVEMVTQQVAISRGINLVLNRAQILGTTNEFDLTPAVVEDVNKVLGAVVIPPEGVSPSAMKPPEGTGPASAQGTAQPTTQPTAKAPAKPPATAPAAQQQHR
jgi:hypothetical protein